MKKKNGFIAISLIYSFFLCFVILMMGLLSNYIHSKLILDKINQPIEYKRKTLSSAIKSSYTIITDVPDFKEAPTTSGLYLDYDDDGESYYFRGLVENNYVDLGMTYLNNRIGPCVVGKNRTVGSGVEIFRGATSKIDAENECISNYNSYGYSNQSECIDNILDYSKSIGEPLLWRIVRINGDGTIRLITDNGVMSWFINNYSNNEKYVGFTYDNLAGTLCNFSSLCDVSVGTAIPEVRENTMKTYNYIDLESIEKKPVKICNDTSIATTDGVNHIYGAYSRINNEEVDDEGNIISKPIPSLKCPNTNKTYGGFYKLEYGYLTVDEVMMTGFLNEYATTSSVINSYLWYPGSFWTISPAKYDGEAKIFTANINGKLEENSVNTLDIVYRPVINIDGGQIVTGDGTKTNPYKLN